ncbi:2-oxo-4-hydroxy-4-carboxy-5-ureidoimidazoline decarboxylase [Planotetraspora sp. A-T 1434]|uniref:2-oxo-4-hydroxy-4-carboxy-5-ureidoimidazoline decarboxylase n=1 Tax=Planotetraspora sp. A-T 1434 TaxID=2979219 RepID=UPI0021C2419C|nr:2-oxo-4-hydroxy-4-carboxy-5-ureidoimidazoline decarboxylase [Planotetraspora sp. A-T 1434]MCT9930162.1 2-oxo-4-hydroxy-4-carboxy-5-ureidoimidazoline decarboxylase [Planotetraspora sp. A-T 1434]
MRELSQEELRSCCASTEWVSAVAAGRPYRDAGELVAAGQAAIAGLSWEGVEEALAAHPRIGERPAGDGREAAWSRREQSGTAGADPAILDAIAQGNLAYERRFGHVYLICATGRRAEEMLDILLARLANDEETERKIVRDELSKIVTLRLEKLWEGR